MDQKQKKQSFVYVICYCAARYCDAVTPHCKLTVSLNLTLLNGFNFTFVTWDTSILEKKSLNECKSCRILASSHSIT